MPMSMRPAHAPAPQVLARLLRRRRRAAIEDVAPATKPLLLEPSLGQTVPSGPGRETAA